MTPGHTIEAALRLATSRLTDVGIEDARREARILVGHAVRLDPQAVPITPERTMDQDQWLQFNNVLGRRCSRRPMAQVLGRREFWSLNFEVSEETLAPRPDSETLVEAALAAFPSETAAIRILDMGTGTGCLLLSVLSERPAGSGLGIDLSEEAVAVARRNAVHLGLDARSRFEIGDWTEGLAGPFDLVIANPPYIRSDEIPLLEPEVGMFEPSLALDGGPDGLDCYRKIAANCRDLMAPDGRIVLEIGIGQAMSVAQILSSAGLADITIRRDLAGIERCVTAQSGQLIGC